MSYFENMFFDFFIEHIGKLFSKNKQFFMFRALENRFGDHLKILIVSETMLEDVLIIYDDFWNMCFCFMYAA